MAAVALFAVAALIGVALLQLPAADALIGAAALCLLHWLSVLVHHLGHAIAAGRTGHAMRGVQLWGLFARDVYPAAEGDLPARVHVSRALGGPLVSALLTLFAGALWFAFRNQGGWLAPVLLVFFLDNALVFTLQACVPLGFNDGATLWMWVPRLRG